MSMKKKSILGIATLSAVAIILGLILFSIIRIQKERQINSLRSQKMEYLFEGTLRELKSDLPVKDALIYARWKDGIREFKTDTDGQFSIELKGIDQSFRANDIELRFMKNGFEELNGSLEDFVMGRKQTVIRKKKSKE